MIPDLSQIALYKDQPRFITETICQIEKDFNRIGIDFESKSTQFENFESLINFIQPTINRLLECHSEKIFSLFYLIDIPEKAIRAPLDGFIQKSVSFDITKLIVERELLKVLTRAYFSNRLHGG